MKTNTQNIKLVGKVTYGNGLGRHLGFPTANVEPSTAVPHLEDGVWAGYAIVEGHRYPTVVNVGFSPSVVEHGGRRIEAHIVGFEGDLYGREVALELHYHLRPERKFPSREALVEQIAADKEEALRRLTDEENLSNNQ